jgi:hypothetical protein
MPGNLPLYSPKIRDELTRYIGDQWPIIVDTDVDGEESEPFNIDRENSRIGSMMAARRVSRTIFLGSAPSVRQQKVRGVEDIRIRLGVAQPEENLSIYADALSRLTDRLTYLYHDNKRYWYDTRPNLIRTVEDRAAQWDLHDIENELRKKLLDFKEKGVFARVHVMCEANEIPDEMEARLVILGPQDAHRGDKMGLEPPSISKSKKILDTKGTGPRVYKNSLLFLAPEQHAIENCLKEIRRHLAWQSVIDDEEKLGLDAAQRRQAKEQVERTEGTVKNRLAESYSWLLTPYQEFIDGSLSKEVKWDITKVNGTYEDNIVSRASKKAIKDQKVIRDWSPLLLKLELDRILWKNEEGIDVRLLWDYMAKYLYLPRLANEDVLLDAIRQGLASEDYFGYAAGRDPSGKYMGVIFNTPNARIIMDGSSVLIRCELAKRLIAVNDSHAETCRVEVNSSTPPKGNEVRRDGSKSPTFNRFHGSVILDPQRVGRDASQIAEEVIAHLACLPDAEVMVSVEIQVKVPGGVPEGVVRVVNENAKTLKFKNHDFEGV